MWGWVGRRERTLSAVTQSREDAWGRVEAKVESRELREGSSWSMGWSDCTGMVQEMRNNFILLFFF